MNKKYKFDNKFDWTYIKDKKLIDKIKQYFRRKYDC